MNLLRVNYVMLVKSHLQSYPCPLQINTFYNFGFLLGMTMIIQIVTGIMLTIHYNSDTSLAFQSVLYLYYEVYNGNILRYFHSNGASIVFFCIYIHISRSLFYQSYLYNPNPFSTGLVIFLLLMAIAFLGYTLPYGQMSFWGATVITNLLSPFPNVIEWCLGGFTVSNPTIKRFFIFHFILPFVLMALVCLHIFYLHFHSSSNPLRISTNNKIPFFPYLILKDCFSLFILLGFYFIQCHYGLLSLSHPDNSVPANPLVTPAHIVPEWYFLVQYSILKCIPNKNTGFLGLVTSITFLFLLTESRNVTTLTSMSTPIASLSLNFLFLITLVFFYIGAQAPTPIYISTARVLTVYYYLLLHCILLTHRKNTLLLFIYSFRLGDTGLGDLLTKGEKLGVPG